MVKLTLFATVLALSAHGALAQYSNPLDPWRACNKFCPDAAKGNPIALHTCFLAAYVRVSDPYLGGEDLDSMFRCMGELLKTLGDVRFADALALERPEVRSAVGYFFQTRQLLDTPKTRSLISKAPKIDFPLSQTNRDPKRSQLLQRFLQHEEEEKARRR